MFERFIFNLSLFVYRLFQGGAGLAVAAPHSHDEAIHVTHVDGFQDFSDASRGLGYTDHAD